MDEAYYDDPFENEYEPDLFSVNGTEGSLERRGER